jgi:hypothetical protein
VTAPGGIVKKLILSVLVLNSSFAQAESWNRVAQKIVADNNAHPFSNPYAASVWAGVQNRTYSIDPSKTWSDIWLGTAELHNVMGRPQFLGDFRVLTFVQATRDWASQDAPPESGWPSLETSAVQKAPLALICPGSFSNLSDSAGMRLVESFASRGYHVVVMPNPLSLDYINAKAAADPGHFREESQVLKIFAERVVRWIGPSKIMRVEWVGESYGALLATAAASVTRASESQLLQDARVTGFGAPIDLDQSTAKLDRLIAGRIGLIEDLESEMLDIGWDYYWADNQSDLPDTGLSSVAYADAIFSVSGFQTWLYESTKVFAELFGFAAPARDILFSEAHARYRRIHDDELEDRRSQESRLSFWLSDYAQKGGTRARYLSARDDVIIQDASAWTAIEVLAGTGSVLLVSQGGHLGFTALAWYQEFLDANFGARRTVNPYFYTGWLLQEPNERSLK